MFDSGRYSKEKLDANHSWGGGGRLKGEVVIINPLTPVSDQERISPYNIYTVSFRQVMRIK